MSGCSNPKIKLLNYSSNPDDYKHHNNPDPDIETIYNDDIIIEDSKLELYKELIQLIEKTKPTTDKDFDKLLRLDKQFKHLTKSKAYLLKAYNILIEKRELTFNKHTYNYFIKKRGKSLSGVLVITVVMSPKPDGQNFSCEWNCYFCPNEPGQPRSYLHDEPAVLRANRNEFDVISQILDRLNTLEINGHPIDKIELLILGGTFTSYPTHYQEKFMRDIFYALNTYYIRTDKREPLELTEEKNLNNLLSDIPKCIGITIELRPDCINAYILRRLRYYGVTRVQMGAQHTNDKILELINRGCTLYHLKRAIKMLKDACFKLDIHIMPNLPGASVSADREMFDKLLYDPDLQCDQWKIYPCEIVPWTIIKKWYEEGKYVPYPDNDLVKLLVEVCSEIHPWIRVNRVKRDIPAQYVLNESTIGNLRNDVDYECKKKNIKCKDIRAREVKGNSHLTEHKLFVKKYQSSDGIEYFISFNTPDEQTIFGFCRLRLSINAGSYDDGLANIDDSGKKLSKHSIPVIKQKSKLIFPELVGCALIRELHVYGQLEPVDNSSTNIDSESQQHIGFGKQLMAKAKSIAIEHNYTKIAVISGVGVRNYYKKLGYVFDSNEGEFMINYFDNKYNYNLYYIISIIIVIISSLIYYLFY